MGGLAVDGSGNLYAFRGAMLLDKSGSLYFDDVLNNRVRVISTAGIINTSVTGNRQPQATEERRSTPAWSLPRDC